jgi:hypothetical protein
MAGTLWPVDEQDKTGCRGCGPAKVQGQKIIVARKTEVISGRPHSAPVPYLPATELVAWAISFCIRGITTRLLIAIISLISFGVVASIFWPTGDW